MGTRASRKASTKQEPYLNYDQWNGVEHLGERGNHSKGTRQNHSLTSEEGGPDLALRPCTMDLGARIQYHIIGERDCLLKTQDPAKW